MSTSVHVLAVHERGTPEAIIGWVAICCHVVIQHRVVTIIHRLFSGQGNPGAVKKTNHRKQERK